MTEKYGYFIFRNNATRTYEVVQDPYTAPVVSAPDYTIAWDMEDAVIDYFPYNYLRDAGTNTVSYDPVEEPTIPETPDPNSVTTLIILSDDFPLDLLIAFCSCIVPYSGTSFTSNRMYAWGKVKGMSRPAWLSNHWIAILETWCRWYALPLVP